MGIFLRKIMRDTYEILKHPIFPFKINFPTHLVLCHIACGILPSSCNLGNMRYIDHARSLPIQLTEDTYCHYVNHIVWMLQQVPKDVKTTAAWWFMLLLSKQDELYTNFSLWLVKLTTSSREFVFIQHLGSKQNNLESLYFLPMQPLVF